MFETRGGTTLSDLGTTRGFGLLFRWSTVIAVGIAVQSSHEDVIVIIRHSPSTGANLAFGTSRGSTFAGALGARLGWGSLLIVRKFANSHARSSRGRSHSSGAVELVRIRHMLGGLGVQRYDIFILDDWVAIAVHGRSSFGMIATLESRWNRDMFSDHSLAQLSEMLSDRTFGELGAHDFCNASP